MIRRIFLGYSDIVRAIALAFAALSLAFGVALTEGLLAAMLGAAAGSIAGQHLARSRLRLGAAIGACAAGLILLWAASAIAVGTEALPNLIGPANTLRITACVRFGALSFATAAALRTLAARRPAAAAVELAFVALAITTVFAAHRDGVIARPLWLSDWAWRQGLDPARILLGVGVASAGALALLLLLETKSHRRVSSLLVVTALAILAATSVSAWSMPAPDPLTDLGLKGDAAGDKGQGGGGPGADAGRPEDAGAEPRNGKNGPDRDYGIPLGSGGAVGHPDGSATGSGGASVTPPRVDGHGSEPRDAGGAPSSAPSSLSSSAPSSSRPISSAPSSSSSSAPSPSSAPSGQPGDAGASSSSDKGGDSPHSSSEDQLADEPEDDQSPTRSPAPMAVVLLENDYSPPSKVYYFREEALSQFNGSRLVVSSKAGADLDIPRGFPAEASPVASPPPSDGRELVGTTVVLLTDHTKPFGLEAPSLLAPSPNPNPSRFKRAYHVESLSQSIPYKDLAGRAAGDPSWPPDVRDHYTEPPSDPRYGELARTIAAGLRPELRRDPFALALAVKLYLDKSVTYSTKARHAGVPDPTADMLFGDRIGYCVHFAHAAVFLWRSLGLPARVGVGYRSEEDSRRGGSTILLRANDAHAWPELYLEGAGWIVLDVAPALNIDEPTAPVDDELQRLLGQMARGEAPEPAEELRETWKLRDLIRQIGAAGFISTVVAVILLYFMKLWRRLAPRFAGARSMPRVAYRSALDALAEAGLTRHFGETREAFAERARALSPAFEELTWLHLAARLREPKETSAPSAAAPPETLRALLQKVRGDIAERGSPIRRFLGLINPASFLDAK